MKIRFFYTAAALESGSNIGLEIHFRGLLYPIIRQIVNSYRSNNVMYNTASSIQFKISTIELLLLHQYY